MANNYVCPGEVMPVDPGAAVATGSPRIVGDLIAVSAKAGSNGVESSFVTQGVWRLPKATGFAVAQGKKLIFDSATNTFVASATAGDLVGGAIAYRGAGSSDTTVEAMLCPGCGVIEPSGG